MKKIIPLLFVLPLLSLSVFAEDKEVSAVEVANLLAHPEVSSAYPAYVAEVKNTAYILHEMYNDLDIYKFVGVPAKNEGPGRVYTYFVVKVSFGLGADRKGTMLYQTSIEKPQLPR